MSWHSMADFGVPPYVRALFKNLKIGSLGQPPRIIIVSVAEIEEKEISEPSGRRKGPM
jgi:hypothetical protein